MVFVILVTKVSVAPKNMDQKTKIQRLKTWVSVSFLDQNGILNLLDQWFPKSDPRTTRGPRED